MGKTLKEALAKNKVAAEELDKALRDCLAAMQARDDVVVEGRFRIVAGARD